MKTLLFLLCFFCFSLSAKSQTNTALQISGTVTDSVAQTPINLATVILKNDKKIQIQSVLTAKDGSFVLNDLVTGTYSVSIVHIGYQTKMHMVSLAGSSKILGTIGLTMGATQLKGVTVSGDKPLIKQEIDRLSYDVKADPESKVNNVLEMMRKVPLLSVDADDNIQLQGNSNYKILVNGRPSGMMERNPKDILRSMPAASIEKIEVITTPPAKYDGEGLAGIINIITFKKSVNGTNGTINTSHRFPVGGPGVGGSFTLKSGKFGIATNAGGNLNSSPLLNNSNSRLTLGTNPTDLFQTGTRDFSGKTAYVGTELSFEIDSLNLLSGQLNYNANKNESLSTQLSTLYNSTSIIQSYGLKNNLEGSGNGFDAALNYQLGFKKDKNRLLTFSYRYFRFSNDQFNSVDIYNPIAYNLADYRQNNMGGSTEETAQIDYVYPLKKVTIELGAKAIFRNNNSDFRFSSMNSSGSFEADPLRTNTFDNQQNVYGVYNTYQFMIKNWGVKAGVRAEQTEIDANFAGGTQKLNNTSLNLIPSISINRKFKNMSSINFGFTSRIQRPGINQLNPFVDRSNPNFESSGNPDLKPTTGNSFEVTYSRFKKVSLNIGARGMLFENLIMPSAVTDPVTQITRSSFANTGSGSLMGANVNLNYPFNSKLRAQVGAQAMYGKVKGEINGILIKKEGLMRRAFTSVTYRPSKTWQGTASMNYNGPNLSIQGTTNSFLTSSFSINKELFDNKLTLSIAANNVFDKYRKAINFTNGPNFTQESYNQNYQRNFTTSLNYRFGKLKDAIKKNKKGINNNDVSEGTSL
ncbi:outer membrane beta-barrel family protein [Pedobacter insulae]|uniref:Outer membrane receptor proteins, mostly Fe transport n=1 Tax=Pedobacter insulae TaxID=414048 RepID=A0A1I2YDX9_9SPHI|nr:outer membrane beta-barrel family protein [Pedobacter insulae]SFH23873.1 Outer membrane receptor proteins, mostly Fe transport [Pedobacter insulae]